jgi:hypothetical protein
MPPQTIYQIYEVGLNSGNAQRKPSEVDRPKGRSTLGKADAGACFEAMVEKEKISDNHISTSAWTAWDNIGCPRYIYNMRLSTQWSRHHGVNNYHNVAAAGERQIILSNLLPRQLSSIRQEYHTSEAQRCRTEPREKRSYKAVKRRCTVHTASSLIRFRAHVS